MLSNLVNKFKKIIKKINNKNSLTRLAVVFGVLAFLLFAVGYLLDNAQEFVGAKNVLIACLVFSVASLVCTFLRTDLYTSNKKKIVV